MNKKQKKWFIISVTGCVMGIMIIMVPFFLNMLNNQKNARAISSMTSQYDDYAENSEAIEEQFAQARAYNAKLAGKEPKIDDIWEYDRQLSFDGDGVMGYIEIPKIGVRMLIYHGTEDEALAVGAGHLEGTSLPVGGESTHAVITAHSGMKTMQAFDRLRELEEGDIFIISVLGRHFTYEVESYETVLPYETDSLHIVQGEDLVTLVTCTPYGINSHRLLVHGKRIE